MRYLQAIQTQLTPFFNAYVEAFEEVVVDVNAFLDRQLESDFISNVVISGIVATPFFGVLLFVWILMLSA